MQLSRMGLDSVELVMAWEEAFGIEVPNGDAEILETPRMVIDYFAAKLGAIDGSGQPRSLDAASALYTINADGTKWTRAEIRTLVREIIVEQLGVAPDFSDDVYFVRDLGVS